VLLQQCYWRVTTTTVDDICTHSARQSQRYIVRCVLFSWTTTMRRYFKNVFINWNPSLFSHRTVLHQEWPVEQGPANDTYNLGYNPQYTLVVSYADVSKQAASVIHKTTANTPTVWVLLSRHVTTVETDDSSGDYLTMHLYDVQNEPVSNSRVYYPDTPLARGKAIIYFNCDTHAVVV
jgi:hypothetical protein